VKDSQNYESVATSNVAQMYDEAGEMFADNLGGNLHAGFWQDIEDHATINTATTRLTDMVIDRIRPTAGEHVLDIGCGNGAPALRLAARYEVRVTGITVSHRQVDEAGTHARRFGVADRIKFTHADAMNPSFPDSHFDAAFAIESLAHMSDPERALGHVARALQPNGRLVIADLLLRPPVFGADRTAVDAMCETFLVPELRTKTQYMEMLQNSGFQVDEFTDVSDNVRRTYAIEAANMETQDSSTGSYQSPEQLSRTAGVLRNFGNVAGAGFAFIVARRVA
jgi:cyclopropane fatty-acyl-phospholipid synthase-like methyltransferase